MADFNQFGSAQPPQSANAQHCAQCEAMLADVLDGTLSPAEQTIFDLHVAGCSECSAMLADARRGATWLEMLKSPAPEPSSALLDRILAQTSGIVTNQSVATQSRPSTAANQPNTLLGVPSWTPARSSETLPDNVLPFRKRVANAFRFSSISHTLMQPRLAMTAAMAFFSIALTLNLTGVRLSQLRASDFKPSSIKRSFYETNARVARTFDNMRVVYELESRVRDLQRSAQNETPAPSPIPQNDSAPASRPSSDQPANQNPEGTSPEKKQPSPRPKSGTSRSETPAERLQYVGALSGRGTPPAALQAFVTFTPNVFKDQQEGGLV